MAYTDTSPSGVAVKKVHLTELVTILQTLATNKSVTISLSMSYDKVNVANLTQIQTAIHKLESSFSGNCCQSDCCQTCQGCQKCQSCQGCQSYSCQSYSCQSCQRCQSECNCNCKSSDCQ